MYTPVVFGYPQPSTQAFSSRSLDLARNAMTTPNESMPFGDVIFRAKLNALEEKAWVLGWATLPSLAVIRGL